MDREKRVSVQVEEEPGTLVRIDRYISERLGLFSRSQIPHRRVRVTVNGEPAKLSRRLHDGDLLEVTYCDPEPSRVEPQPVPLSVIYENERVVVIDKPQGMVVHPAAGNYDGTLVQGLLYRYSSLGDSFEGDDVRPGIVHRLDKETSGVLIAAKDPEAREFLASRFALKQVHKTYLALVKGRPSPTAGRIESLIGRDPRDRKRFAIVERGGKQSATRYRVLSSYGNYSFVRLRPETGRTHQLRVHMASIRCPILGDPVYSRKDARFPEATLMLHAFSLRIRLPGEEDPRTFRAPLPERFGAILRRLSAERRQ